MGRRSKEAEWDYIISETLKILEKENKEFCRKGRQLADSVIETWYDSYGPKYYAKNRKKSLYRAITFSSDEYGVSVHFGHERMISDHGKLAEYIYTNSFEEGYHGGARQGIDKMGFEHPEPGTPWYMRFYGEDKHPWAFDRWSKQDGNENEMGAAVQTFSPKEEMIPLLQELWGSVSGKYAKEFARKIMPRVEKLRSGRW